MMNQKSKMDKQSLVIVALQKDKEKLKSTIDSLKLSLQKEHDKYIDSQDEVNNLQQDAIGKRETIDGMANDINILKRQIKKYKAKTNEMGLKIEAQKDKLRLFALDSSPVKKKKRERKNNLKIFQRIKAYQNQWK